MPIAAVAVAVASPDPVLPQVTITAQGDDTLLQQAQTASEGAVTDEHLQLLPVYRPGQLLETVPGLIVTVHSGEGKANQYLLRGYSLDHGADLETYVDGMPSSAGDERDGYSVTGMLYHQLWTNTTDIPARAITDGLLPDRFGSLDPTDGGRAWRSNLKSGRPLLVARELERLLRSLQPSRRTRAG